MRKNKDVGIRTALPRLSEYLHGDIGVVILALVLAALSAVMTIIGPNKIGGKWEWDYVPVPSRACDLCAERREAGKVPLCELHCLAKCIEIVPVEDVSKRLADLGEHKVCCFMP